MCIKTDSSSLPELQLRIDRISGIKLQENEMAEALRLMLGSVELTSLEGLDTNERIQNLCIRAKNYHSFGVGIPDVAAVCVYPTFVKLAKVELRNSEVVVASVAGAFPSGQSPISVKLDEIKFAADQGAGEIDMVISRGLFLEGRHEEVFNEIVTIRKATRGIQLKVILETGELNTPGNIRLASEMAIQAGADFIGTSTGKITPGATEESVLVIIDVIKEYYNLTGKIIGIKPAGGICEPLHAIRYFHLVRQELGEEWLNKDFFRIGANCLGDKIIELLVGETA
jgi:deoxyribose-phosphate aldolase